MHGVLVDATRVLHVLSPCRTQTKDRHRAHHVESNETQAVLTQSTPPTPPQLHMPRHHMPPHSFTLSHTVPGPRSLEWVIEDDTEPARSATLLARKITTRLPSFGEAFTQQVPLTRIRDIAHRGDIPHVSWTRALGPECGVCAGGGGGGAGMYWFTADSRCVQGCNAAVIMRGMCTSLCSHLFYSNTSILLLVKDSVPRAHTPRFRVHM